MTIEAFLAQVSLGDVGFAGLLSLAIFLILRGALVPRSTVDDIRADRDAALASSEATASGWKDAFHTSEAARSAQSSQIDELLEIARTTDHLVRSLQDQLMKSNEGSVNP